MWRTLFQEYTCNPVCCSTHTWSSTVEWLFMAVIVHFLQSLNICNHYVNKLHLGIQEHAVCWSSTVGWPFMPFIIPLPLNLNTQFMSLYRWSSSMSVDSYLLIQEYDIGDHFSIVSIQYPSIRSLKIIYPWILYVCHKHSMVQHCYHTFTYSWWSMWPLLRKSKNLSFLYTCSCMQVID